MLYAHVDRSGVPRPISILCVDDNPYIVDAIHLLLSRVRGFAWAGSLSDATELVTVALANHPDIILLDIDMPGPDPFEAVGALAALQADSRVIVVSGYVRRDLISRAVKMGAWGYVAKSDGEQAIVDAIAQVATGEFVMSAEARACYTP